MRKIAVQFLIFITLFFAFSATTVSAKIITNEKGTVSVAEKEVINDDLFIGAETAEIYGTVNGDVFIGAQTAKIGGTINGSLHIGAKVLNITGNIKGNAYAGAQDITLTGSSIGGSLLAGAVTITIDKTTKIGGSLIAAAGTLSLDSQVNRSVYAGARSLGIGGNSKIGKDVYYIFDDVEGQVIISDSAKIGGTIHKSEINTASNSANLKTVGKQASSVFNGFKFITTVISFFGALIVGFLYLKLSANHFIKTADTITKSFWKSMGVGFLVMIALVPGLIVLCITIIGIPLAGLTLLLYLFYAYLSKIIVGLALGSWVSTKFSWQMTTYITFVFGFTVFSILRTIPALGFLIGLVVLWIGLGALTLQLFAKSEQPLS